MKFILRFKKIIIAILFSVLLSVFVARAITPYQVSVVEIYDHEFPRIQAYLEIEGETEGLSGKHIYIRENENVNSNPLILLPPHPSPKSLDLNILIDHSAKLAAQKDLVKSNLKALINYIFTKDIDLKINLFSLKGGLFLSSKDQKEVLKTIDDLTFSTEKMTALDGFSSLIEATKNSPDEGSQKIMLLVNGTTFLDQKTDGATGQKMKEAVQVLNENYYLTFILGSPLKQIYMPKSDYLDYERTDFSSLIQGGYLGGYGVDLTSLVDLLMIQAEDRFVLQYYTQHPLSDFKNSKSELFIDDYLVAEINHQSLPLPSILMGHFPENEINLQDHLPMELNFKNNNLAVNAALLYTKNAEGIFSPIFLSRSKKDTKESNFSYQVSIPSEEIDGQEFLSYYFSVLTPYSSQGNQTPLYNVPLYHYDSGIILKAIPLNDKKILWQWSGPTVDQGKAFEVWSGDKKILKTEKREYIVDLNECNRYQIFKVKVIFPDLTESQFSKPHEYYLPLPEKINLTEKAGVELMLKCLNQDMPYINLVKSIKGFNAYKLLNLERATFYLNQILYPELEQKMQFQSEYYTLLHYIMNFLSKDDYTKYLNQPNLSHHLIYKFITKAHGSLDLSKKYERAFEELSNRLRGQQTL